MRTPRPITEDKKQRLQEKLKETKTKGEYQRVLSVWLRAEFGSTSDEVAKALGWHPGYVRQVQARYIKDGESALAVSNKGGRYNENLSLEEEEKLLRPFLKVAEEGGVLVASKIKAAYEELLGRGVHKTTIYRMLDRHGWRKIAPRPHHPKSDPEKQEAFKKTSRSQ